MPYVPRLIEEFQSAIEGQAHPECALCALAEIALRDAGTLRDHSERICEEVSYILRVNPTACRISKWTGESACQLLGELGGLACKPSLQQAVDMGVPGAAIALERIVTREKMPQPTLPFLPLVQIRHSILRRTQGPIPKVRRLCCHETILSRK